MPSPKFIFVLTVISRVFREIENRNSVDYFSGSFNAAENCKKEDLMTMLEKETPKRCAIMDMGDPGVQWENCKKQLSRILQLKCTGLGILKVGIYIQSSGINRASDR